MFADVHDAMKAFELAVTTRDHVLAEAVLDQDFELVLSHPSAGGDAAGRDGSQFSTTTSSRDGTWGRFRSARIDDAVIAHFVVHQEAVVLGEDRSGLFAITDVWRTGPDGWRVWKRFSAPMSAGDMPGV